MLERYFHCFEEIMFRHHMKGIVFINKKSFLLSLLVGVTMALVVLYVLEVKENKTYEAYLSEKVVNHLSVTSSSIEEIVRVVQEVLANGEITDKQAPILATNFRNISLEIQDLAYIGQRTKKEDNLSGVYNVVVPVNYEHSGHFSTLFQKETNGKITLNEEQIAMYEAMEDLLLQYLEIFNIVANGTEGLTHREKYGETAINEEYWMEILNEMADVTEHPLVD
jgi:hypothetical protein